VTRLTVNTASNRGLVPACAVCLLMGLGLACARIETGVVTGRLVLAGQGSRGRRWDRRPRA